MPRIVKSELLPYRVLCDTNILWQEDKGPVCNPEFESFWKANSAQSRLSLYLPDVVIGELQFQHHTSCSKLLKTTEETLVKIGTITTAKHVVRLTTEKVKTHVSRKFTKWTKHHRAHVLNVPVSSVDWNRVVRDAIWRLPPFTPSPKNPDAEKGFRDCLILETVCHFVETLPENIAAVFLSNDAALRTAVKTRLATQNHFYTFESIKDFEGYLQLTREKLTREFSSKIISRAAEKFYSSDDDECLYIRGKVRELVESKFKSYFDDVTKSEKQELHAFASFLGSPQWKPLDQGVYWITAPQFVTLDKAKTYIWKSRLTFVRRFIRPESSGIRSLIESDERILLLPFDITWCSDVKSDARFYNIEVMDLELKNNEFRELSDSDRTRWKLNKLT